MTSKCVFNPRGRFDLIGVLEAIGTEHKRAQLRVRGSEPARIACSGAASHSGDHSLIRGRFDRGYLEAEAIVHDLAAHAEDEKQSWKRPEHLHPSCREF